jgi:outer membrane protein
MRRILTLGAALAGPLGAQQLEVSLDEAVRRALQVQPAMVQARGDQRTAAAGRRSALGAFLPSLSTSWSASRSNVSRIDPTTGRPVPPEYTHTVGLSATMTLFDGLNRFASVRASAAQQDAAEAGYVSQRYQTTLATKQVFYDALAREELVRVAEAQVRRAEQQLQISIEKLRAGSATRSDSLRSTVEFGNARIALLQARANLATAQANLGRQIGVDALVRAAPDTALPTLPDTAALRAGPLESAPQVQQADALARAARADVLARRSLYVPTVTVSYNDNHQGTGFPEFFGFGSYNETFSWRFGLSWTLFNGFARESQNTAAAVARDNAVARAGDARRAVGAEMTQQLAALTTAFEQIDIARANLAAATEDLRVQQERYRVGAATILDLLTSQASLTQAEVNLVQTRFNYFIARAELEALVGRTL